MNRPTYLPVAAIILLALALLGMPGSARAHAVLLRADPAENSILESSPTELKLWLSEPISPRFSSLQILDGRGQPVAIQAIHFDPANPTVMRAEFSPLPDGVYSALWKVLSETDGHFTQGIVVFGVGASADLGQAAAVVSETAVPLPEVVLRWLNFTALMGLVGTAVVGGYIIKPANQPPALRPLLQTTRQKNLRWARNAIIALFIIGIGWALWQAQSLTTALPSTATLADSLWQWLFDTRLGRLWWLRLFILLGLFVALTLASRRTADRAAWTSWQKALVPGLLILLALTQSLTSHAASLTRNTPLAVAADTLHLLAAGVWAGGLLALAAGLLPVIRRFPHDRKQLIQAGWGPFSRFAALSVAIVAATGLYSTGRQVASVDAMITTLYGRSLLLKIGLMLLMGGFGAANALLLHADWQQRLAARLNFQPRWLPISAEKMPRIILAEVALGLCVVMVVSLVTAVPTANGQAYTASDAFPETLSQTVDDLFVTLSIRPNRPGQNVLTVRAVSNRKPAPAEINRVILRLTYQDLELGTKSIDAEMIEPGYYLAGGPDLNLAGPWKIDVAVRRLGMEDTVARFEWQVVSAEPRPPTIISNRLLEPYLILAGAALLLVVSLILTINLKQRKLNLSNQ